MKRFNVNLIRGYNVLIEAENEEQAKRIVELFIGDPKDDSNAKEKAEFNFHIDEIELTMNEALEAEEVILNDN